MDKCEWRKEMKRRFALTSCEERQHWSDEICQRIGNNEHVREARCIMAFYPLADEPDITPLLHLLWKEGKTVILPEVISDHGMQTRLFDPETEMADGSLGTKVPQSEVFSDYEKLDVVLVPGVAFDRDGGRMGRGKGYYDRFLSERIKDVYKIGVCFPYQMIEEVPCDKHDIRMDYV